MSRMILLVVAMVIVNPVWSAEPIFEPPKIILDASSYLYPSPVYEDIDGDDQPELLIGDLRGYLSVYKNVGEGRSPQWGKPTKLQASGKELKLPNW